MKKKKGQTTLGPPKHTMFNAPYIRIYVALLGVCGITKRQNKGAFSELLRVDSENIGIKYQHRL